MFRPVIFFFLLFATGSMAQVDPTAYQDLHYRMIGPFRAGRTVGAVGIPSRPNVFFIGVNNGGVWKTDDYGRTWKPIFDSAPTGSIGDLAVSASNPDIIYVGTGEGLHRPDLSVGDGLFKSTDGGKNWVHMGLDDVQQISRVIVHPTDTDIVFVAGLGHPYGANEERGIFRSLDGGFTWEKTLYLNHNTGAVQVEFDPNDARTLFADLWEHQEGPWENASFSGPNSGLYKSTDGGATWRKLEKGLPTAEQGLGRIGVAIAKSNSKRMYATVDANENGGVYRSDDGGESWLPINNNGRLWGRGSDFAEIKVHPLDENVVFVANVAAYKSVDGGESWTSIKGAPGGDDYHRIWINPLHPDIMLFAADQGAVVTVNGGETWGSWYNQPTAQLYHVSTDDQFPYWVYGGQQESGAIGVASRGNGGQISFRDWMGVGADEYAYVAADPKDPDIVYGGRVIRYDKRTGQSQQVAPEILRSGKIRYLRSMPLLFHPADDDQLLFATNVVWKTLDGGQHWEQISPDLTRTQTMVPESLGDFKTEAMEHMPQRAIVYALGPSPLNREIIWAGTDDGLVQLTLDGGKTWKNVTPPSLKAWDKVAQIDAGHFDAGTAYIAVNAIRKDNMRPQVFKTHDYGETWEAIVSGMASSGPVNVVREDVKQPGLLFAGTEREVYFSIDDGRLWQSLRQNMPATSIRDLVVHENDLVIGTHGRSIWILDDFSPLRELPKVGSDPYFHEPSLAFRVRFNTFADTPLPPDEPAGQNPPDGALLDYQLSATAKNISMEIIDAQGNHINRFTAHDTVETIDSTRIQHPTYWMRPQQQLKTSPGHHRFVWNLRYKNPQGAQRAFPIAAVKRNTPSTPLGPWVAPGTYTVRLSVDGQIMERQITVRLDPRAKISELELQLQSDLTRQCYTDYGLLQEIRNAVDIRLADTKKGKKELERLSRFRGEGKPQGGDILYGSIVQTPLKEETLVSLQEKLLFLMEVLQSADARPAAQTEAAVESLAKQTQAMLQLWRGMQ